MFRFTLNRPVLSNFSLQGVRHATKKAGGSTKNGRDSPGQRLGVKKFGGEAVIPGNIIIRQRGAAYKCGENVKMGRDHTIYTIAEGFVKFEWNSKIKRYFVSVTTENPNIPKTNFERGLFPKQHRPVKSIIEL